MLRFANIKRGYRGKKNCMSIRAELETISPRVSLPVAGCDSNQRVGDAVIRRHRVVLEEAMNVSLPAVVALLSGIVFRFP